MAIPFEGDFSFARKAFGILKTFKKVLSGARDRASRPYSI